MTKTFDLPDFEKQPAMKFRVTVLILLFANGLFLAYQHSEIGTWHRTQRLGTIAAYRTYLHQHPYGKYASEANHCLQNATQSTINALDLNSGSEISRFMKERPDFDFKAIDTAMAEHARKQQSFYSSLAYLEAFPYGHSANEFRATLDSLVKKEWDSLRQTNDDNALQVFIKNANSQLYRDLAQSRLRELYSDYDFILNKNTIYGYKAFIENSDDYSKCCIALKKLIELDAMNVSRGSPSQLKNFDISDFRLDRPETGTLWYQGSRHRIAPFTIETSGDEDYLVKLVPLSSGNTIEIYVRGGTTTEVKVPLGRYEMRYASGNEWYGNQILFGPSTSCSKSTSPLSFTSDYGGVSGYTVTLYRVPHGNMLTSKTRYDQF